MTITQLKALVDIFLLPMTVKNVEKEYANILNEAIEAIKDQAIGNVPLEIIDINDLSLTISLHSKVLQEIHHTKQTIQTKEHP